MLAGFSQADDSVEFLNGTMMNGTVLEIRSEAKEFDFQSTIGQQQITRTYPYNQVHAVTFNGKRFVITPKPDVGTKLAPGGKEMNAAKARAVDSVDAGSRTKAQVLAVIDESGRKPPDWFASTTTI